MVIHALFEHSSKKFTEFDELAHILNIKGLKLLRNVKVRWLSMIDSLNCLLSDYCIVFARLMQDSTKRT